MTKEKFCRVLLGIILLFAAICGGLLSSPSLHADDAVTTTIITVPVSCTMNGTGMGTHTAQIQNGVDSRGQDYYPDGIGTTTLKAYCNDNEGFAIYAVGYSDDTLGNTYLRDNTLGQTSDILTGTTFSGNTSAWAMKIGVTTGTYTPIIAGSTNDSEKQSGDTDYSDWAAVPSTYTRVAYRNSGTDVDNNSIYTEGSSLTTTYAVYVSPTQIAHFYGPNEDITVPEGTTAHGLSLYAVWIKSAGNLQDSSKVAELCGTNGSLTAATYSDEGDQDESTWSITANLSSISALTDTRDGQTYAIAKLTDDNCWMIENLRLADTHQEGANTVPTTLTVANTNNPLNDNDPTSPTVILKHNYSDTQTFTNLSATSSVGYNADTAPDGWCNVMGANCYDQSRLRTDNTASRASYTTTQTMSTNANLYSHGNYYNWYSATAGRGTRNKSSGNTEGDLCPNGWHLPYGSNGTSTGGGNTSGGFYYLAGSISATTSNAINSKKHRHFPNNLLYSGYVDGASINNRGSFGAYWSSTANSNNNAFGLSFYSSSITPGTAGRVKNSGGSARCIASTQ